MSTQDKGWMVSQFTRLSTGLKMLLILSLALVPLGLIAILASIQSAQQKNADRAEDTLARLEIKAQRLNAALSRSTITIGTASVALSLSGESSPVCERILRRLEGAGAPARYALFAGGRLRCASPGFVPPVHAARIRRPHDIAVIDSGANAVDLFVFGEGGVLDGVAQYPRASLAALSYIPGTSRNFDLALSQSGRRMVLRDEFEPGPFSHTVRGTEPVAGGQLELSIALSAPPIGAADILMILLPVLMWLFAAFTGWLILNWFVLRPLAAMQQAVAAYRPGMPHLNLPHLATPAREIGELGESFDQVARTVARHEEELEAAVARQTKLVREVHHRVKNNLQVVASLLNLHARGSPNEEVSAAYASIQRRVDALAVVHRNHYAELEENRGVALKPLISELGANLRATAPPSAAGMVIRLDLDAYYATQDVAVSIAFLITEIVEFAMLCGAASVQIALTGPENSATATLTIESDSLRASVPCDPALGERFERIVTGLSRQLRSAIERDMETGRYSLEVAVVAKAEGG